MVEMVIVERLWSLQRGGTAEETWPLWIGGLADREMAVVERRSV